MGFISRHRWGKKIIFIKKTDPTFYTPFLFIKYSKTTHWKHHIHVIIQNVKKRGIFSIEKNYGAFNRGTLIRFLRNILHLKKKHYFFSQFSQFFLSLKYKYTIMCNYLNKYTNINDADYIRYTSLWYLYKKCIPYLSGILFSKLCSNNKKKKKSHYGFKVYPCPNILT
jgi:hypothetical protein